MFPDDKKTMNDVYKIQHSMRVMPHDQNTGGFFVALFKKNSNVLFTNPPVSKPTPFKAKEMEEKAIEEGSKIVEEEIVQEKGTYQGDGIIMNQKNNYISFADNQKEDWEKIVEYFGITSNFPSDQLFIHDKGERTVIFVNKTIADFLSYDTKQEVNRVNLGIRLFEKSRMKTVTDVNYRLTQSGIETLFPFITKRRFEVTQEELMFMANHQNFTFDTIEEKHVNVKKIKEEIPLGFFVCRCEIEKGVFEYLVGQKMKASLVILADKEHIDGMRIKYQQSFYASNL